MMRICAVALALALPVAASAACVVSTIDSVAGTQAYKIMCDTGSEAASVPTLSTQGISPAGFRYMEITAEAANGQTFTAAPAGTIAIYLYDANVGGWGRCRDCGEPSVKAVSERRESFGAFDVKGPDRIMLIPLAVTLSGGNLTLYVTFVR
jgi:hypothetical protein